MWNDHQSIDLPSEFSMMRGTLPSMTATAELVVPKSIPMTEPFTFSSPPSAYPRAKAGALKAGVRCAADATRGKNYDEVRHGLHVNCGKWGDLQFVIILRTAL